MHRNLERTESKKRKQVFLLFGGYFSSGLWCFIIGHVKFSSFQHLILSKRPRSFAPLVSLNEDSFAVVCGGLGRSHLIRAMPSFLRLGVCWQNVITAPTRVLPYRTRSTLYSTALLDRLQTLFRDRCWSRKSSYQRRILVEISMNLIYTVAEESLVVELLDRLPQKEPSFPKRICFFADITCLLVQHGAEQAEERGVLQDCGKARACPGS